MKKSILASLLVPILLAGCSDSSSLSSSSTSTTTTTYTWQIVHLESVDEDDLESSCVIYADSTIETDDSTIDDPEYQVVTAYKADDDYNILYHYQDGTIAETIEASDITDGSLTITLSDVPDDGYVTLEELDGTSRVNYLGSYMFSVQKSLLDDMLLNVAAASSASTACVTGSDHREGDDADMFANINQLSTSIEYYQSSYDELSIDGNEAAGVIPVDYIEDGTRDILITAFEDYDPTSEEKTTLSGWTFIDSGDLFEAEYDENGDIEGYTGDGYGVTTQLNSDDLTDVTWSQSSLDSSTITLNDSTSDDTNDLDDGINDDEHDSGVIVTYGSTTYLWQPIYESTDTFTVAYEADEIDAWNSYFSGTASLIDGDWTFTSFNDLTDEETTDDTDVELMNFSTSILSSLDGTTVIDNTSSIGACTELSSEDDELTEPSYCIDLISNFDPNEFTYQRLHIRLEDTSGENFTNQTIISEANTEPVVLSSTEVDLGTAPTLTRIELNLMNTNDDDLDAVQYLMTQNIDLESVAEYATLEGDDSAETDFYNDLNGYVATDAEIETLYQAVLETNTTIVQSTYEP